MGTYATTTSLATFMIGTTFDTATTALATSCITWAEEDCDKYLGKRYDLDSSYFATSTSTPPLVRKIAEELALGYMHIHNSRGGKESLKRGEMIQKAAFATLQELKDYKLQLTDTSGAAIPDSSNTAYQVRSNTTNYSPTFNEDDPLDWEVSSDKLEDIDDERDE